MTGLDKNYKAEGAGYVKYKDKVANSRKLINQLHENMEKTANGRKLDHSRRTESENALQSLLKNVSEQMNNYFMNRGAFESAIDIEVAGQSEKIKSLIALDIELETFQEREEERRLLAKQKNEERQYIDYNNEKESEEEVFEMTQMASDTCNGGADESDQKQDDSAPGAPLCMPSESIAEDGSPHSMTFDVSTPDKKSDSSKSSIGETEDGKAVHDQATENCVAVNFVFPKDQVLSESQSRCDSSSASGTKRIRPDDFDDTSEDAQLEETNNNYTY